MPYMLTSLHCHCLPTFAVLYVNNHFIGRHRPGRSWMAIQSYDKRCIFRSITKPNAIPKHPSLRLCYPFLKSIEMRLKFELNWNWMPWMTPILICCQAFHLLPIYSSLLIDSTFQTFHWVLTKEEYHWILIIWEEKCNSTSLKWSAVSNDHLPSRVGHSGPQWATVVSW